eukprot:CAMPEP_0202865458 /NCGR_PEP_ID=MMETSP1391-20130828/6047_1 /ASSEMBLY_ACC=CAM_ASM_000867 /TAXON_ID=1034604 /ORGANISM="Chlamydomonas leiostraca, Strain SAG 11-49" /LENGTH=558 /DNA_ID=CAMNT_0049545305 /DNA_START=179 /DNA_END=1851 /DNA_ORIENTATION=+
MRRPCRSVSLLLGALALLPALCMAQNQVAATISVAISELAAHRPSSDPLVPADMQQAVLDALTGCEAAPASADTSRAPTANKRTATTSTLQYPDASSITRALSCLDGGGVIERVVESLGIKCGATITITAPGAAASPTVSHTYACFGRGLRRAVRSLCCTNVTVTIGPDSNFYDGVSNPPAPSVFKAALAAAYTAAGALGPGKTVGTAITVKVPQFATGSPRFTSVHTTQAIASLASSALSDANLAGMVAKGSLRCGYTVDITTNVTGSGKVVERLACRASSGAAGRAVPGLCCPQVQVMVDGDITQAGRQSLRDTAKRVLENARVTPDFVGYTPRGRLPLLVTFQAQASADTAAALLANEVDALIVGAGAALKCGAAITISGQSAGRATFACQRAPNVTYTARLCCASPPAAKPVFPLTVVVTVPAGKTPVPAARLATALNALLPAYAKEGISRQFAENTTVAGPRSSGITALTTTPVTSDLVAVAVQQVVAQLVARADLPCDSTLRVEPYQQAAGVFTRAQSLSCTGDGDSGVDLALCCASPSPPPPSPSPPSPTP